MEIDEKIFSLKVFKNQAEFFIKDGKNLMNRLKNEEDLVAYHKLSKSEKNEIIDLSMPETVIDPNHKYDKE